LEIKAHPFGTKSRKFDTFIFDGTNLFAEDDESKTPWIVCILFTPEFNYFSQLNSFLVGESLNRDICPNDKLELNIFGNLTSVEIGSLVYFSRIDTPSSLSTTQNDGYILISLKDKPWDLVFDGDEIRLLEYPYCTGYFNRGPYETKIQAKLI
jgi:hypothetical protein